MFQIWHEVEGFLLMGMLTFAVTHMCYAHAFGFHHVNWWWGSATYGLQVCLTVVTLWEAPLLFVMTVPLYSALLGTMLWRAIDR